MSVSIVSIPPPRGRGERESVLDIIEREAVCLHDVYAVLRNKDGSTSEVVVRRGLTLPVAEELTARLDRQMADVDDYVRTRVCRHEPEEEV